MGKSYLFVGISIFVLSSLWMLYLGFNFDRGVYDVIWPPPDPSTEGKIALPRDRESEIDGALHLLKDLVLPTLLSIAGLISSFSVLVLGWRAERRLSAESQLKARELELKIKEMELKLLQATKPEESPN